MEPASQPSVGRRLFDLALPLIGINVLNVLTLVVDTLMCARLDDAETALAALGFATQLGFLMMVAMIGLTVGAVALVSRAHGAKDRERANLVLDQATLLTVVVSVLTAIVGNVIAGPMLDLLGATGAVHAQGLRYLRPWLGGCLMIFLPLMYVGVLRGIGNTRLSFVIALAINVANVALNYGLILGHWGLPSLGVQGAAIGTVIAYGLGVVLYAALVRGTDEGRLLDVAGLRISLIPRRFERVVVREMFDVGWPAALDMVILNVGFLAVVGLLGRISDPSVAAHGIGLRVQGLAFVPGLSVSWAAAAMVGQALGRENVPEARAVVRAALLQCFSIMTLLGIVFVVFSGSVVAAFDAAPGSELEALTRTWIEVLGLSMPIFGVHIAFVGMLHGSGSTWLSMGINAVCTLGVQVPAAWLLGFVWDLGALGVWLSFPVGFGFRMFVETAVYRGNRWTRVGVHV